MIELASKADIAALQDLWKKKQSKPSYDHTDPEKMERERLDDVPRDAGVIPPKWKGFERVDAEYRASEEKRKAKRGLSSGERMSQKAKERAENERWDRIFKEKFEDKSYYDGVRV